MQPTTKSKSVQKQQQQQKIAIPLPEQSSKIEALLKDKPLIPQYTLDPFSTSAFFLLYNVLNEKDRFGIIWHKLYLQPSISLGTIPYFDWDINTQSMTRTCIRDSREEVSSFVIAILESIMAYLKYESFKKSLPHLKAGLSRYADSYGDVTDNAITSFRMTINRIEQAIEFKGSSEEFQNLHFPDLSPILNKNRVEFYDCWSEDEISQVINGIFLAIQKKENNKDCQAEVEASLKYLQVKQGALYDLLKSKSEKLNEKT